MFVKVKYSHSQGAIWNIDLLKLIKACVSTGKNQYPKLCKPPAGFVVFENPQFCKELMVDTFEFL